MHDPKTILREAISDDLAAMQSLFANTIRVACREDYSPAQIDAWTSSALDTARWTARLAEQYTLVVEQAGELLGFASLQGIDHLDLLYVQADHQRQGIAGLLCNAIEDEAIRRRAEWITADASKTARPFFEHIGYVVVNVQSVNVRGVELENFRMIKSPLPMSYAAGDR